MNLSEPPWQEFIHRPTAVSAFQWFKDMGECIPHIKRDVTSEIEQYVIDTHWEGHRFLTDGDWVVRGPLGEIWAIKDSKIRTYYEPRRKG